MRKLSTLLGVALFLTPALGFAQGTPGEDTRDGRYSYRFDDDPLGAVQGGPWTDWFRVRAQPPRTTLIRPRVQFIPELLKSTENI